MSKKLVSVLLAILIVALMGSAATAQSTAVASIGEQTYDTLKAAANASASGDTILLLNDVSDEGSISLHAGITLDGQNHTISGNSSLSVVNDGNVTIQNTKFNNISNSKNNLSAIYASGLKGTLTVKNCEFNGVDWDAIQTTPVAGANVVITNNTFKNSETVTAQRYIHIQSQNNVDFSATVTGNKMYAGVKNGPLGCYYYTDKHKINIANNYIAQSQNVCLLMNDGENVYEQVFPLMNEDLTTVELYTAIIKNDYFATAYTSVQDALNAQQADQEVMLVDSGASIPDGYFVNSDNIVLKAVASIGNTNYSSLHAAVDAAGNDATIKVLCDTSTDLITIRNNKSVILDLNGYTLTPVSNFSDPSGGIIAVERGGNLTIKDSSANGSGKINSGSVYSAVKMTTAADTNTSGIAKLTVDSGTLIGHYYAICGNGSRPGTEIIINGGTVKSSDPLTSSYSFEIGTGIFHPQQGTLTINGGTVQGNTGIEMRAGTLIINGGTIQSTSNNLNTVVNGNGTTVFGAAVALSQHTTNLQAKIIVNDGTLNGGSHAVYQGTHKPNGAASTDDISIAIKNGTFNGTVAAERSGILSITGGAYSNESAKSYLPDGYTLTKRTGQTHYTVGRVYSITFNVYPKDAKVEVRDSANAVVAPETDGSYSLMDGSYSYTVSCDGYISNTTDFEVDGENRRITVSLKVLSDAAKPVIENTQLSSATYTQGMTAAALSVTASITDDGTLSYQWYKNTANTTNGGTKITGATGSSYTPATDTIGTSYYYCIVTNNNTNATNIQTSDVTSSVATITVTAKEAGKHTAEITVNGQSGVSYIDVKAVLKKLGDAGEGTPKELTMSSSNGKQVYLYQELLEDGDYNLVITAKAMINGTEKEVTLTELIHLLDADDKHETSLPETTKSSVVADESNLGIIAGNVDEIAAKLNVEETGGHLEVVLTTNDNQYDKPEDKQQVENRAKEDGVKIEMVLDIDLTVIQYTANETSSSAYDLGNDNTQMLKIMIPMDLGNRDPNSFVMYRVHNDELKVLPRGTGTESYEHFTVSQNNITIYATKFSSYVIAYGTPANITYPTQDETVTAYVGQTATMEITAENAGSYQWQINRNDGEGWVNCINGTESSYTTSATKLENNGYQYRCQVTSKSGVVSLSRIFTLEVIEQVALPQTGDNSSLLLWSALLGMAGVAFCLMMKKCRA